jgi:hypothetical protein
MPRVYRLERQHATAARSTGRPGVLLLPVARACAVTARSPSRRSHEQRARAPRSLASRTLADGSRSVPHPRLNRPSHRRAQGPLRMTRVRVRTLRVPASVGERGSVPFSPSSAVYDVLVVPSRCLYDVSVMRMRGSDASPLLVTGPSALRARVFVCRSARVGTLLGGNSRVLAARCR